MTMGGPMQPHMSPVPWAGPALTGEYDHEKENFHDRLNFRSKNGTILTLILSMFIFLLVDVCQRIFNCIC